MSASVVSLSNRALLSVGARANISDLQEDSTESDAINTLFVPTFEALARSAPWNCLRKQISLTLLAAAIGTPENPEGTTLPLPPVPWLYQYALPSDCLQVRFLVPSIPVNAVNVLPGIPAPTYIPGGGQIPFAVAYATDTAGNPLTVILTNQTQAQCVYTVDQSDPTIWDSLFQTAFVASLAAYLVPALSLDLPLMDRVIKQADAAISIARTRDGNEGVTSQNRNASWMTARMQGGLCYSQAGYGPWLNNCYQDMAWPG